jgi:hypothetical protein
MKKRALTIAASLIPLAGLLLAADAAWAQAKRTSIQGEWGRCWTMEAPESEWVDENGIRHILDVKYRCTHYGDLIGRETGWESIDVDPAADLAWGRGYSSFVGTVLGEPAVAVGRYTYECSRIEGVWICTEDDVWHLDDGSLIKFTGIDESDGSKPYREFTATRRAGIRPMGRMSRPGIDETDGYRPYLGIHIDPPGRN